VKSTVGIIGYGIVGKATEHLFGSCEQVEQVLKYDKYSSEPELSSLDDVLHLSDFLFLCLPTPFHSQTNRIDLSAFEEVLKEIDNNNKASNYKQVVVIKSTIVPGTTARWEQAYPNTDFAFCPEFLTEANNLFDSKNPSRFIVGASKQSVRSRVIDLHEGTFDSNPQIFETGPTEAEIAKYASNCFLASKVMFANEMSGLADHFGLSWNDDISKLVTSDPRIGDSHFQVSQDKGFSGKCFPKDMVALLGLMEDLGVDSSMLKSVWNKNLSIREKHDWLDIPGVVTEKH
jgi:nucleotide sugar dehydrogenase